MQHADGLPFAALARNAAKHLEEMIEIDVMNGGVTSRTATFRALQAVYQAEKEVFRSDLILQGSRDRGVWPFNAKRIRQLADLNHRALIDRDDDTFEGAVISKAMSAAQTLLAREPAEISTVSVTPKKNTVYTVSALRKQQFEEQLDAAIEADGERVEKEEKQALVEKEAVEARQKRRRDEDEREEHAQKKAKKRIDDVR